MPLDPRKAITQYILRDWQGDQGLPQNTIMTMIQSRQGYVWLGTHEGLVRFDGSSFKVFDKKNTDSVLVNKIYGLHEGSDGALWIATYGGGVVRMQDEKLLRFTSANGLPSDVVWAVCGDRQNQTWLGTEQGLARILGGEVTCFTTENGLVNNAVRALLASDNGDLWVGTVSGLSRLSGEGFTQPLPDLAREGINAIFGDRRGRIWFGTVSRGVYCLDGGTLTRFGEPQGVPANIMAVCQDGNDGIWIGTRTKGVLVYRNGKWSGFSKKNGLSDDWIRSLLCDREGGVWIGTTKGGVNRVFNGKFLLFGMQEGLPENNVLSVFQDSRETVWVGTAGGLYRLELGRGGAVAGTSGLITSAVFSLYEDSDGTLLAGTDGGLYRVYDGRAFPVLGDWLTAHDVNAIFRDRDRTLWIGTNAGLFSEKSGKVTRFTTDSGLSNNSVRTIIQGRDGSLWIGTYGGGLDRFGSGRFYHYGGASGLTNPVVVALHEDREGGIWIATGGGGLNRWKNGKISAVTLRSGLFDDSVHCMQEDDRGNLWMSCNKGIFLAGKREIVDVLEGRRQALKVIHYDKADGLRSNEFNGARQSASCRLRDGRLCFASVEGLVIVDPQDISYNRTPPRVLIEEIWAGGARVNRSVRIEIPAWKRGWEFQYTAFNYDAPEKIRFRFKLEGFDSDWIEAGPRRTAYYTNVPHGEYRFRVIACNTDGVWNETGDEVLMNLQPYFHETWWFYSLCGLFLAVLGAGIYQMRIRQLKVRERRLLSLVEERTHDLHQALEEVGHANRELERLSLTDSLTQLPNRRNFELIFAQEWKRCSRDSHPLSLLMIDIDFFKTYNDAYGHLEGDECLRKVGAAINRCTSRAGDFIARLGGEEFVVLLPNTPLPGADLLAERVRQTVEGLAISHGGSKAAPVITISVGVATVIPRRDEESDTLVANADRALYHSKRLGRNRCFSEPSPSQG